MKITCKEFKVCLNKSEEWEWDSLKECSIHVFKYMDNMKLISLNRQESGHTLPSLKRKETFLILTLKSTLPKGDREDSASGMTNVTPCQK